MAGSRDGAKRTGTRNRPSTPADLFDRAVADLGRRHVGAVAGLDLGDETSRITGVGRTRLPDGAAPDGDTSFEIGSITKTFTALVLARAVVEGRLGLDTAVRDLLPAGTAVPSRDGKQITLADLAQHRSGLPRSPQRLGPRAIWAATVRGEDPYAPITVPVLLDLLGRTRLRHTPGQGPLRYSNFGVGLLGVVLTRALGAASYAELVTASVLTPLGLSDTAADPKATSRASSAEGHALRRRPAPDWRLDGLAGAGALRSTARDMLRFLRAQLAPDATTLGDAIRLTQVLRDPDRPMSIGLGWMAAPSRSGPMLWHNGGTGGYRSFAGFLPGSRRAAVILVNDQKSPDLAGMRLLA